LTNICIFFSVIDTGGVFRNVTELFWKNVKTKKFEGGKLFDGDQLCIIQQNSIIVDWEHQKFIGIILFWSWIHGGSWPRWLDPLHLQYFIEGKENVVCLNALHVHSRCLYDLAKDLMEISDSRISRKELIEYWVEYNGLDVSYILIL
jgi:hypothetical protein